MPTLQTSIVINVPVETAYDQWRQFEKLPQFLEAVRQVKQLGDNPSQWEGEFSGQNKEWETAITDRMPDHRRSLACQSDGITEGIVAFQQVSDVMSKVLLQLAYTPDGAVESVGNGLGTVSFRMQEELERFKVFAESSSQGTGTTIDNLP